MGANESPIQFLFGSPHIKLKRHAKPYGMLNVFRFSSLFTKKQK